MSRSWEKRHFDISRSRNGQTSNSKGKYGLQLVTFMPFMHTVDCGDVVLINVLKASGPCTQYLSRWSSSYQVQESPRENSGKMMNMWKVRELMDKA